MKKDERPAYEQAAESMAAMLAANEKLMSGDDRPISVIEAERFEKEAKRRKRK